MKNLSYRQYALIFMVCMGIKSVQANPYRQYTWQKLSRNPIIFFAAIDMNTARLANQTYVPGATTNQNRMIHPY